MTLLRRVFANEISALKQPAVDADTLAMAAQIVQDVRHGGEQALIAQAVRLGDLPDATTPFILYRDDLQAHLQALPQAQRALLERTAARITRFAQAQRDTLNALDIGVLGGRAGHQIAPVDRAGCYAPGGRYPLPSSVLMTALTARAAGVKQVWLASPNPQPITLAAAAIANVDAMITIGGAQAIAALAYGAGAILPVDVIVGPGNRWVTAAKQLVCGHVGIDMLAGPSELVVLADDTADAATIAADLLGQAEHDADARPILVTTSSDLIDAVNAQLALQLASLQTRETALMALSQNGVAILCGDLEQAHNVCDTLAPEHLEVHTREPALSAAALQHYGALFLGSTAAEVFGDYGVGPNHVLPTGGTARFHGGLSVFTFLRIRTWLRMDQDDDAAQMAADAAALAKLEGLQAHAASAMRRLQ